MKAERGNLLLVLPALATFAALFACPFLYFFAISFFSMKSYRMNFTPTLANYLHILENNAGTLAFTLALAAVIASLATVLGLIYAYAMRFRFQRQAEALLLIAVLTLFGGYLMKIYAWKTILGTQGVLNLGLVGLGLTDQPLAVLLYSPAAVAITLVNFLLPMAILPIYSSLRGIPDIEIEAARDLGASPLQQLRDVILPRAAPGLISAFALCFLISAGDYVTPALVGGTTTTMGSLIAPQFGSFFNWPLGAAMSFVMLTLGVAAIFSCTAAVRLAGQLLR